jgi:hypothetical protein
MAENASNHWEKACRLVEFFNVASPMCHFLMAFLRIAQFRY